MKQLKSLTYSRPLSIAAAVLVPVLSYYLLELMTHNPFEIPFQFQLLGWLFCYLLSGLVFFLCGQMNLALILPLLFTAVLGSVNYFVLQFRQSPILPWDIASAGTALSVADHFSFTPLGKAFGDPGGLSFPDLIQRKGKSPLKETSPQPRGRFWLDVTAFRRLCALPPKRHHHECLKCL